MVEHTPGPWIWQSFDGGDTFFLGTADRGRLVVMDFVRQGMQRATVRFARRTRDDEGGRMEAASFGSVDSFPDARVISAAPELLAACKLAVGELREFFHDDCIEAPCEPDFTAIRKIKAAIARAEGREMEARA